MDEKTDINYFNLECNLHKPELFKINYAPFNVHSINYSVFRSEGCN
jgi:hypothetical protein